MPQNTVLQKDINMNKNICSVKVISKSRICAQAEIYLEQGRIFLIPLSALLHSLATVQASVWSEASGLDGGRQMLGSFRR